MDLSKDFDAVNHQLLLAKLPAWIHQASNMQLLIKSKSKDVFSSQKDAIPGVPQELVVGPLLYNYYPNDLLKVGTSGNGQ